ncbi:phosphoinositide 3-kinase regulatory subunit 6 [Gadus chalcogrammus]|uniref:phosphoinositide 3-kinase regulatory subunit 6 n=1 Tax=Gadus chalcogrammus TaxID=1042646 RepID=UPI0024C27693|nr:phosphoinositide 3-kinase regulatory subunit 6 [Gadus chalcogrammus]
MSHNVPWVSQSNHHGMEAAAGRTPALSEPDLYRSVQAILPRERDCHLTGMLRWTLNKKVQNRPDGNSSLVCVVIKELEKAERLDCRKNIIPLLHTLMYAVLQTAHMPAELHKRVYNFCKRLLTFPQPYCSTGLSYSRLMKAECCTPGLMYQRRVVAEQSLKNQHYPFQERVFVFADPEVFSGPLGMLLQADIQASNLGPHGLLTPLDHMSSVIQHSIQAALGPQRCNGPSLVQALRDMGQDVEPYFQEVVATLEQNAKVGCMPGKGGMLGGRLDQLYQEILATARAGPLSCGPLCDSRLPNPEISFHMWTDEEDIRKELYRCVRSSSMSEQFSLSQDPGDALETSDLLDPPDTPRHSVMSVDSGIERDLPPTTAEAEWYDQMSADLPVSPSADFKCGQEVAGRLSRKGGMKMKPTVSDSMVLMQDTLEEHGGLGGVGEVSRRTLQRQTGGSSTQAARSFSKEPRPFTARIVVMGDDRVLGRLAKAYYGLRKREARKLFLTQKVNLQFYYIPVSASSVKENVAPTKEQCCAFGSYLGMVDPWYNCHIRSLGVTIPELAKKHTNIGQQESLLSDVISYYVRMGREPVRFSIYQVKISFCCLTKEPVEQVFLSHLEMELPEFRRISPAVKEKQQWKTLGDISGAVVSMNYKRVTLSGRDVDTALSVKMFGAQITAIPSNETEDLNCLTLTLNEAQTKNKSNLEQKIRISYIKIRSLEKRSFTVTLDKDTRRAFKDVQSIEISSCLDPCYCLHKSSHTKPGGTGDGAGLSQYMNRGLPLAINTFSGIIN